MPCTRLVPLSSKRSNCPACTRESQLQKLVRLRSQQPLHPSQGHPLQPLGRCVLKSQAEKQECWGLCHECQSPHHKWRDCPQRKPPSETPSQNNRNQRPTNAVSQAAPSEELEDRCQRLIQEWVDAEFALLTQGYENEVEPKVDSVTGAVGPLYYCTVMVEGQPVRAMVNTGSSASILSFEMFCANGKKAGIPMSSLYPPKITL